MFRVFLIPKPRARPGATYERKRISELTVKKTKKFLKTKPQTHAFGVLFIFYNSLNCSMVSTALSNTASYTSTD